MAKNHLKRIAMPSTWTAREKKRAVWIAKVNPGAHSADEGMPLVLVIREVLRYANTAREARQILNNKAVLVDGIRRKDLKFNVGLMDIISMPELKESYRISLDERRRLNLVKIDEKEAGLKLCRINGKGMFRGKIELRLSDGRTILISGKSEYKVGDSLVIEIPKQKIAEHLKLENGSYVMLTDGKRIGSTGNIEEIKGSLVKIKSGKEEFDTLKKYCFVAGKQKPVLTIR